MGGLSPNTTNTKETRMTDTTPIAADWWTMPPGMERELAKYDQCEEPGDCDHDHDNAIEHMREAELHELEQARDGAYRERAHLVALLAAQYPSLSTPGEDDPDWRIVFVDLPTGQASWHVAPGDWGLFAHVPQGLIGIWDGHSTEEKYRRVDDLVRELHEAAKR